MSDCLSKKRTKPASSEDKTPSDDENKPPKKTRTTPAAARAKLLDAIESRIEHDKASLDEAKETEQAHHDETKAAIHDMSDAVRELTRTLQDDNRRRAEDAIAQRTETAALLSVIKSLAEK